MADKRKHTRMAVDYEVFVNYRGRTLMARASEISVQGIGLHTRESLEQGEPVELSIVLPRDALNLNLQGQVRYCVDKPDREKSGHTHFTGVEFDEETGEDLPLLELKGDVKRYKVSHSVSISAPARRCYELICDFERYPEWAGVMKSARIRETFPDGRARLVEFEIDVFIRRVRYLLDYTYDDENLCLSWVSAGGDLVSITGRYFFKPLGPEQTSSVYELDASLDFFLPNRIVRYFSQVAMRKTMKEFKSFVEKARP